MNTPNPPTPPSPASSTPSTSSTSSPSSSPAPSSLSRRWLLGSAVLAAAAGAGLAAWRTRTTAASSQALEGFWQQRFARPDGGELQVADFKNRPLLVNFWATWCPPCVEELPMLEAFWRDNNTGSAPASTRSQVLALAIDQPSAVRRFLERQKLALPIGLAGLQGTELSRGLGNSNGGLPFSVFLSKDGQIYRQKLGQLSKQDLQDWQAHTLAQG